MKEKINILIEIAKGKVINTVNEINNELGLPSCVIDGVISSVLSEIRGQTNLELVSAYSELKQKTESEEKEEVLSND